MVKLQRIYSRTAKGRDYYKWQITLPAAVVDKSGWEEGAELVAVYRQGRIVLRPKSERRDD